MDNFQCVFQKELILYGDDNLIFLDIQRLSEAKNLSFLLHHENQDILKTFLD